MNREEIARIIDPVAWANFDHVKKHGATPASENSITKPSLKIADKILSASPPEQPAALDGTGAKLAAEAICDYADNNLSMFEACSDEDPVKARQIYETAKLLKGMFNNEFPEQPATKESQT